jgi:tetratricopeptide (TPR) repeat protein
MASVFLSYDRDDTERARHFARALERAGHDVWWDPHVRGGAQFSKEIEQALKSAHAVVVLWSSQAVESAWVRDEAAVGRDTGRLVPVTIDGTEPPLGFRQFQTINLSRWRGRGTPPQLKALLASVNLSGASPPAEQRVERSHRSAVGLRQMLLGAVMLAAAAIAASLLLWRPWAGPATATVVAIRPADQSPYAKELARDLVVALADVPSAGVNSLQLVDEDSTASADLIFEVSGSASNGRRTANLVLLRGLDRQLLSSQDLEAASNSTADLKGSLTVSAAQVLRCATEALGAPRPLTTAELKLYSGLCQRFATVYGSPEPAYALAAQFEEFVRKAPHFTPAWKKLLLLEASLQMLPDDHDRPSPDALRQHIVEARRIDPHMPEAEVAEAELLPTMDFARRLALVDRAVADAPDDALMFAARASQLMRVGRHSDAVNDVEQAVTLDRFSATTRNAFILVLAHSGRLTRALNELDEAQRLWPTAHNLLETRFRYNYRYGDFQIAEQIMRAHGSGAAPAAFFAARADPTATNVERAIFVAKASGERYASLVGSTVETLVMFGRNDEAYEFLSRLPPSRFEANLASTLFRPTLKSFRQSPRFIDVTRRFGLLNYWRKSGKWPDFCSDPDLPYDCKAEAAKLG